MEITPIMNAPAEPSFNDQTRRSPGVVPPISDEPPKTSIKATMTDAIKYRARDAEKIFLRLAAVAFPARWPVMTADPTGSATAMISIATA